MLSTVTTKGQVTIPIELRKLLGLSPGRSIVFSADSSGEAIVIRPAPVLAKTTKSGAGMFKVKGPLIPADFDVASLVRDGAGSVRSGAR